jgi:hypothetical protein
MVVPICHFKEYELLSGGSNQIGRTYSNTVRMVSAPGFSVAKDSAMAGFASFQGMLCAANRCATAGRAGDRGSAEGARTAALILKIRFADLMTFEPGAQVDDVNDRDGLIVRQGNGPLFHSRFLFSLEPGKVL